MRKHFLILMLMALLPFTAWAEIDLSDFSVQIQGTGSVVYNGSKQPVTLQVKQTNASTPLTETTHYVVMYFLSATAPVEDAISANDVKDAKDYYVCARGVGDYTGYTERIKYTITPKDISTATIGDLDFTDCRTGNPTSATYDGNGWEPTATITLTGFADFDANDCDITYDNNVNAGTTAKIIFTASGDSNYSGYAEKTFSIAKADIAVSVERTNPQAIANLTYNGAAQNLVSAGSIDASYGKFVYSTTSSGTYTENIPTATNYASAGYSVWYKIEGSSNYNSTDATEISGIMIAKANAFIISPNHTITYNGTADVDLSGLAKPTFFGFTSADETAFRNAVTYNAVSAENKVGGTHAGAISVKEATYPDAKANYTITQQMGTLTVSKRVLTITASSKTKKYGQNDAAAEYVVTDPVTTTDYTVSNLGTGDAAADVFDAADATTPLVIEREQGEGIDTYAINISGGVIKAAHEDNYELTAASYVPGEFVITQNDEIQVKIYARSYNMTYGDELPNFNRDLVQNEDFIVTGLLGENDLNAAALQLTYDAGDANADTYPINISVKEGQTLLDPAKYDVAHNVSFIPGTLTIAKKAVTFTVSEQIMQQGMVVDNTTFDKTAFTATGVIDDEDKDDIFELSIDPSLTTTVGDVLKIKDDAATSATGIIVKVKEGADEKAANYSYDFSDDDNKGQLTIIPAATLFLNDDSELLTKMTAANTTSPAAVKLGARKFTAEQWNTMVLPFDIAVEDLSANFGYCIVNILNETATAPSNIKFKFHMQGIPANTPFLIKFADDVEISDHTIDLTSLKKVDADDMSVDRTAAPGVTFNYDADDAAENAYFKGNYTHAKPINGTNYGVLLDNEMVNGQKFSGWAAFSLLTYELAPFRAYIVYDPANNNPSQAPIITVEDENGTTAIMSVTSEGRLVEAEGWYTLNGVKLQGVPTQKGIYIHNGKKLVVK